MDKSEQQDTHKQHPVRFLLMIIGAIATAGGLFSLGYLVGHDILPADNVPPDAGVRITELESEGKFISDWRGDTIEVPRQIAVVGTCEKLPAGWKIWVCVLGPNMRYYPQHEAIDSDGEWRMDDIGIGLDKPDDIGKRFAICAVLANRNASEQLYEDATEYHVGLTSLPSGAVICDQVVVLRK